MQPGDLFVGEDFPTFHIKPLNYYNMAPKRRADRDIERTYSTSDFVDKLRRLADSLEQGKAFEISIAGERIYVPMRATFNIEHERGGGEEEIEFQLKWFHEEEE